MPARPFLMLMDFHAAPKVELVTSEVLDIVIGGVAKIGQKQLHNLAVIAIFGRRAIILGEQSTRLLVFEEVRCRQSRRDLEELPEASIDSYGSKSKSSALLRWGHIPSGKRTANIAVEDVNFLNNAVEIECPNEALSLIQ